jgi:hypothetical protein
MLNVVAISHVVVFFGLEELRHVEGDSSLLGRYSIIEF